MNLRPAYTLLELLLVLAIIAALAVLVTGASMYAVTVQQTANTQNLLNHAQRFLSQNWTTVSRQIVRETIQQDAHDWIYYNFCRGVDDVNAEGRIRVIYLKLRQRQMFPMNFHEALYPPWGNVDALGNPAPGLCPCSQLQPLPAYKNYLNSHGIGSSSGFGWESSACLLMALQRGVGGTTVNASDLTAGGFGGVDDAGFGIPVLTDAWSRPIYFSRVPAGCPTLNPPTPKTIATALGGLPGAACYALPGTNDPGDPQGCLQSPAWVQTYGGLFQSDTQQLLAPPGCSYRLAPVVASGGPGKTNQPGFDPITFALLPGASPMYAKP